MRVMKFGGTSVANASRLNHVAAIVARAASRESVAVVVSALAGVTDALATAADGNGVGDLVARIEERHVTCLQGIGGPQQGTGERNVHRRLADLSSLLAAPPTNGTRPAWRDAVLACGERLAVVVATAALRAAGLDAIAVDAGELIATDSQFGEAAVDFETTRRQVLAWRSRLSPGTVPVITGFLGAAGDGRTTTFGRGGSDYSAAILGAALGACRIEIWTDVPGVLSAPPRIVPEAVPLPALSFALAREVAGLGGKVLHPKTMAPAEAAGVPIVVRSTFAPEDGGTLVGPPTPATRLARVVSGVEEATRLTSSIPALARLGPLHELCVVAVIGEKLAARPGSLDHHRALFDRLRLPAEAVLASPSGHALLSVHRRFHFRRAVTGLHALLSAREGESNWIPSRRPFLADTANGRPGSLGLGPGGARTQAAFAGGRP